jgi:hypothetical protein
MRCVYCLEALILATQNIVPSAHCDGLRLNAVEGNNLRILQALYSHINTGVAKYRCPHVTAGGTYGYSYRWILKCLH